MTNQLQGGMSNAELMDAWRKKLPGVEPTDNELTAFALGVESGSALASHDSRAQSAEPAQPVAPTVLKPCPFCGHRPLAASNNAELWWISCTHCEADMSFGTKDGVIALWNNRAAPPPAAPATDCTGQAPKAATQGSGLTRTTPDPVHPSAPASQADEREPDLIVGYSEMRGGWCVFESVANYGGYAHLHGPFPSKEAAHAALGEKK